MALSKVLFLCGLLATLCVQNTKTELLKNENEFSSEDELFISISELIRQILETLSNIKEVMSGSWEAISVVLPAIIHDLKESAASLITSSVATITKAMNNAITQMKEWIAEAGQGGVDATECMVGETGKLAKIAAQAAVNIKDCVANTINVAIDMIYGFLDIGKSIMSEIASIPGKMWSCGIHITCYEKLLANCTDLIISANGLIKNVTTQVNSTAIDMTQSAADCVSKVVESTISVINEITNGCYDCVLHKMNKTENHIVPIEF